MVSQAPAPFSGLIAIQEFDREAYEERAAIMEFDGGLPREHAERLAALEQLYPGFLAVDVSGVSRESIETPDG